MAQNKQCEKGDRRACQESECGTMEVFDSSLWGERRPQDFLTCARRMGFVAGNYWAIPSAQMPIGKANGEIYLKDGDVIQNPGLLLCFRKRVADQKVAGSLHHFIEYRKTIKKNGQSDMSFSYVLSDRYLSADKAKMLFQNLDTLADAACER